MIHPLSDVQSRNIGNSSNVWQFCVILPKAVIGENAKIGAGSVVTKDVEPEGTVIGNPARN